MFIGPRITKVFASRWHAAFWAAGILLSAYEFASHGGPSAADVAQVASIAAPDAAATPTASNPWAPGATAPAATPFRADVADRPAPAPSADAAPGPDPAPASPPQTSSNGLSVVN